MFLMAPPPIITQGLNLLQNFDTVNSIQQDLCKIVFVNVPLSKKGVILHAVTKVLVGNSRESKSDLTWKFDVSITGDSDALWLDLTKKQSLKWPWIEFVVPMSLLDLTVTYFLPTLVQGTQMHLWFSETTKISKNHDLVLSGTLAAFLKEMFLASLLGEWAGAALPPIE